MPKDKEKIPGEDVLEVLQGFIQQNSEHLDRIEKNMATKKDIEGVEKRLSGRIGNVEKGMERLNSKFERLERKMDVMTEALQARMGEQEKELMAIKERIRMK
jgi:hypothetical protein